MINHMDTFNIYGSTASLLTQGVYADRSGSLPLDPSGSSNRVLAASGSLGNNGNLIVRYPLSIGATAKVGIACRMWLDALHPSPSTLPGFGWRGASNEVLAYVGVLPNGGMRFKVWNAANVPIDFDVTVPVVTANAWWHYEVMYHRTGDTTCDIEVRVEGKTVITETGISCRAISPAQCGPSMWANFQTAPSAMYWKDFVVWDGTGTENTTFLGSVLVAGLAPVSDVALNWTSTGPNGYSVLDNVPPDDAQFIEAIDPPPSPYVAALSQLPDDVTSVKALMTIVRAAKTDGGDGSFQVGLISGGVTILGADRPITIAQTFWRDVFETDPDTSLPWLPSAVDAVNLQINRTV